MSQQNEDQHAALDDGGPSRPDGPGAGEGARGPGGRDGAPDPFDPGRFRLGQDYGQGVGLKKITTTVPVRKPGKEPFLRTHRDPAYRLETHVIELKEEREIYLVDPDLWHALAAESTFGPRLLIPTVTRQGVLFLWPIRLPGPDGKIDDWNRSAMEAAEIAKTRWVRVQANMGMGAYEVVEATGLDAVPEFPAMTLAELLRIAFKDRYIDTLDHPVLRKLRGEA